MNDFFNTYFDSLIALELIKHDSTFFMIFITAGVVFATYKTKPENRHKKSIAVSLLFLIPIAVFVSFYLYKKSYTPQEIQTEICSTGVNGINIDVYLETFDKVDKKDRPEMDGLSLGEIMQLYCTGIIIEKEATPVVELDNGGIVFSKEDIIVNK